LLQCAVIGQGDFLLCHPADWSIHVIECIFIDSGGNLRTHTKGQPTLFHDDRSIGFLKGFQHGFHVQWAQGTQIHNFNLNSILRKLLGSFQGDLQSFTVCNDCNIPPGPLHGGFPNGDQVFTLRHFPAGLVEGGMLNEEDWIVAADGGFQQSLGICRGSGCYHL